VMPSMPDGFEVCQRPEGRRYRKDIRSSCHRAQLTKKAGTRELDVGGAVISSPSIHVRARVKTQLTMKRQLVGPTAPVGLPSTA
jgi:hypothetical protein